MCFIQPLKHRQTAFPRDWAVGFIHFIFLKLSFGFHSFINMALMVSDNFNANTLQGDDHIFFVSAFATLVEVPLT